MRTTPPSRLVRFRHALMVVALLALATSAALLYTFGDSSNARAAAGAGMVVFAWGNGVYWWIMLRYPYIEVEPGKFASYDEWKDRSTQGLLFFAVYFTFAALATIACYRAVFVL